MNIDVQQSPSSSPRAVDTTSQPRTNISINTLDHTDDLNTTTDTPIMVVNPPPTITSNSSSNSSRDVSPTRTAPDVIPLHEIDQMISSQKFDSRKSLVVTEFDGDTPVPFPDTEGPSIFSNRSEEDDDLSHETKNAIYEELEVATDAALPTPFHGNYKPQAEAFQNQQRRSLPSYASPIHVPREDDEDALMFTNSPSSLLSQPSTTTPATADAKHTKSAATATKDNTANEQNPEKENISNNTPENTTVPGQGTSASSSSSSSSSSDTTTSTTKTTANTTETTSSTTTTTTTKEATVDASQPGNTTNTQSSQPNSTNVTTKATTQPTSTTTTAPSSSSTTTTNTATTAPSSNTTTTANPAATTANTNPNQPEGKKKSGFFSRLLGKGTSKNRLEEQFSSHVPVKLKKKTQPELSNLHKLQTLGHHVGAIWCAEWSTCGTLLATGGQDGTVLVWAALGTPYAYELSKRLGPGGMSPESLGIGCPPDGRPILHPVPYAVFCGHKADVIDLSWSRGHFLLSGSIDKTARLWHIQKPKCLMVFQHTDFVTTVAFHPIEDRYFLSGGFDRKLRIWNIPHHKVVEWTRTPAIITSACFSPDGYTAVAGLYQGQVLLYHTEQLRYKTQIECRNRSGKDSAGRKVTGLCYSEDGKYLLVTTNDSRLRLYNTEDHTMVSKYKGLVNKDLQIAAKLGPGSTRIICASEDGHVYLWQTMLDERVSENHISACEYFNGSFQEGSTANDPKAQSIVTCADFVPFEAVQVSSPNRVHMISHMILTADANGDMHIFENTTQ